MEAQFAADGALYTGLHWLPPAPADFRRQCKALEASLAPGLEGRRLAGHRLELNQLVQLGSALLRMTAAGTSLAPLEPFKLGIVGNGTLDLLVPALVATAARHGLALHTVRANYGQTTAEALDPAGDINAARPDAVLLSVDHRALPLRFIAGDAKAEAADVAQALSEITTLRQAFRRHAGAFCIVPTLAPPPETLFGSFDRMVPGTARRVIERLNRAILDSLEGSEDRLLDVAALAETVGTAVWHAPAVWHLAKFPFDLSCLPLYAEHVARLLAATRGRSRKCLVLDLDNTVWGGVIGDDGLEGIRTAPGDATGEAHLAVQQLALDLRSRGVVLAVSSKNSDEVARRAFREHPDLLLKEHHFAAFQANWNDKASNLATIAAHLSLGLETLVFLDDNAAERDQVRQALPQVAVPELPNDPAGFARILAAAGYFEAVSFSAEDRQRAQSYQANAERLTVREQAGDLDAYLASLDMQIAFAPFDRTGRVRIAQLINKSNQFNLTTRRYSEAEVAALEEDPEVFTLQVRLADRFGDNGMISVVICRPEGADAWLIDTWLMSCRVLGRKVEWMVLRELLSCAREHEIERLIGQYRPSPKNALVRDHYAKLGFAPVETRPDGTTLWSLDTHHVVVAAPMTVLRSDSLRVAS